MNINNYVRPYKDRKGKTRYVVHSEFTYYSKRYDRKVICEVGFDSDGATGARDINSMSWLVHDKLCDTACFHNGVPCTNLQASTILRDILLSEGRWFRANSWFLMTLAFGGKKLK